MVSMREEALKKLWKDRCDVFIREKVKDPKTKLTDFEEIPLFQDVPCKLSFETLTETAKDDHVASVSQGVKLFLSRDLVVPAGSKIVVKRGERVFYYKRSGEPGVFTYHQEIPLTLFERWA